MIFSLSLALFSLFTAIGYFQISQNLPSIEALPQLFEPPDGLVLRPTLFYDRSGEHVILIIQNPVLTPDGHDKTEITSYRRHYLRIQNHTSIASPGEENDFLSPNILLTTLAIKDPEFWSHPGFTLVSLLKPEQQTLAQELVSSYLLRHETTGISKTVRISLLAVQVTSHFGREKILEWYLNSTAYGNFTFGIDEAARLYFDKQAAELSLAEAAMLAGVSQSPTLNPFDAPQAALERQKLVIQELLRLRLVSPEVGLQAALEKTHIATQNQEKQNLLLSDLQPYIAPTFINLAITELESFMPRSQLERGGFSVITSLDYELQTQANCLFSFPSGNLSSSPDPGIPTHCPIVKFLETSQNEGISQSLNTQSEAVILNPQNGEIMALVIDPEPALQAGYLPKHLAGSMASPFIYLTAFTRGMSPATLVWDTPYADTINVHNPDNLYHGPISLRTAMANDYLISAQKTLDQVGVQSVQEIIRQFQVFGQKTNNFTPLTSENILGEIDILQASQAIGIFANQGVLAGRKIHQPSNDLNPGSMPLAPVSILRVEDFNQQVVYQAPDHRASQPVISPQLAYLVNHVLSDEPARWDSLGHPNRLETGYPLAVKQSHSLDGASHWVTGYMSDLVINVWIGTDLSHHEAYADSYLVSQSVVDNWRALTKYQIQRSPQISAFPVPEGITTVNVCNPSGMLPDEDCPNTVEEIFLEGNEPLEADSLFQKFSVNRQTGQLATVFTPTDLVEERLFMIIPAHEDFWVKQSGIPTPPQFFDPIPFTQQSHQKLSFQSPQNFDIVKGEVLIRATLDLEDMDFLRVQIGQGLNPQFWFQVGEDFNKISDSTPFVKWNTSGLDGLYTIQLLAVMDDQSALRSYNLVTVDNLPPQVEFQQPYAGEIMSGKAHSEIIFRADVQDNIGVKEVTFFVDDKILVTRSTLPYIAAWEPATGDHRIKIIAIDQAGNQTTEEIPFTIQ